MFSVHTTPEEFENGGFTLKTQQMFSVHSTPEELENGSFTLKTHQMFSAHTTPEEFENGGFTLKSIKCFPSTRKRNDGVFKFLRFEERFHKAPFS